MKANLLGSPGADSHASEDPSSPMNMFEHSLEVPDHWAGKFSILAICLILTLLALIFALIPLPERVWAPGYLVPDTGVSYIYPTRPSVFAGILIDPNAVVSEGTPIAVLADPSLRFQETSANRQSANIKRQISRLQRKIVLQDDLSSATIETVSNRREQVQREMEHISQLVSLQEKNVSLSGKQLERAKSLYAKGLIPISEVDNRERQLLIDQRELKVLGLRRHEGSYEILDAEIQLKSEEDSRDLLKIDIENQITDLRNQLSELSPDGDFVRSTRGGGVHFFMQHKGELVDESTPIAAIFDSLSRLEARILLPQEIAGLVRTGASASVVIDSFRSGEHATIKGVVVDVADVPRSSLIPPKFLSLEGQFFEARIQLDRDPREIYGTDKSLVGLSLSAKISIGKSSLLGKLID